jgi:thiol-disulfide isomerase/thioredoxin
MTAFTTALTCLRTSCALLLCWTVGIAAVDAADLQDFTGDPATPPLMLGDLQDRQHSLVDYRDKVVVVNFWAGWCHPCIQEIPELLKLAQLLADRPFVLLAVNVGEERRRLTGYGFLKKMEEQMTVLLDPESKAFKEWKGIGLPSTFIVDPNGQIRYEAYGPVDWDAAWVVAMIEQLMETPSAPTAPVLQ